MEKEKTIRFRFESARERDEWAMAIEKAHTYFDEEEEEEGKEGKEEEREKEEGDGKDGKDGDEEKEEK